MRVYISVTESYHRDVTMEYITARMTLEES